MTPFLLCYGVFRSGSDSLERTLKYDRRASTGNMTAKELEDYVERFLAEELDDPEVQLMLVSFEGD